MKVNMITLTRNRIVNDISISELDRIIGEGRPLGQRIIWGLLLLTGITLTLLQVASRIHHYLQDPILTEIETLRHSSLQLPAITVCSYYNRKTATPKLSNPRERQIYLQISKLQQDNSYNSSEKYAANFDWAQYLRNLWPTPKIKACTFVETLHATNRAKQCQRLPYNPFIEAGDDSLFMSCLKILEPTWRLRRDGFLLLTIPMHVDGTKPVYLIRIHQPTEEAQLYEQPIKLYSQSNEPTKVILFVTRTDMTNVEWKCRSNNSNILEHFDGYSHAKCTAECYYKYSLQVPGCHCFIPLGYPIIDKRKICRSDKWSRCGKLFESFQEETCNCRPLCHQSFYATTKEETIQRHSEEEHNKHLAGNATDTSFKIFIKYTSTTIQHTIQRPAFTALQLMAEIGGILSLLIGLRMLTIIEICDVILFSFLEYFRRRRIRCTTVLELQESAPSACISNYSPRSLRKSTVRTMNGTALIRKPYGDGMKYRESNCMNHL